MDASDGIDAHSKERIWTRADRVSPGLYQVFPRPVESPAHASPPTPEDGREFVSAPEDTLASPLGWHNDGTTSYTIMRGNNVHAYEDGDGTDSPTGIEPDCGVGLNCVFPLDLSGAPGGYTDASIANLFYWTNLVHDVQYRYGFDEAAGNFQVDNFGRGGLGGDPVRAEAQDGSGINNANFTITPDGLPPKIQMFLWSLTTPQRDGDFDNGIIVHEYGHGISTRLVGGPSTVGCLSNFQQPGEGLSDFWTLVYTAKASDVGTDARGIGTYVFGQPTSGAGIRTQPYSTDPAINTHTYESVAGMAVPHGVGEVWAQAAWEVYWALVDAHGFSPDLHDSTGGFGNQRMMLYVNEGLKNTICSPSFTDVRDGIIQAAIDNHDGEDVCRMWDAFARFGLGTNALSGGPSSLFPVNGFLVPDACLVGPRITAPSQSLPLEGDTVTFEWTADGEAVTEWMLDIGSAPQGTDLYQSGSLPATTLSSTVSGLPLDGSLLYVRLHYRVAGVWETRDLVYGTKLVEPKITSPVPGSTLVDNEVTFTWISEGFQVEGWTLTVGSAPGLDEYFDSGVLAANVLSLDASGIPTDSRTLYVRLSYLVGGVWNPVDFVYVAADIVPILTDPAPQSVLPGPDVTFHWDANGAAVSTWILQLGSGLGQSDHFSSGTLDGAVSSVAVLALPTDGTVIHAKLSYLSAGVWGAVEHVFTAADLVPEMVSPSPSGTLPGPEVEFTWTTNGASVTAWTLQIGSDPGQLDVFYSGSLAGTERSVLATGIPTDARTLYVRLRFLASGTWLGADYEYTAADMVPALTSPSPSSTLDGSSVEFAWSTNGATVTGWTFQIGSALGQLDLYYSGSLAAGVDSVTVDGLPTDGRALYAKLQFLWNGSWKSANYVFTAANLVPGILSPVPETMLQSSQVLFTWSANGATATAWIFQIGTGVGLSDVYYSGVLPSSTLSANVGNLPTDGRALFVRLRHLGGTGWVDLDVTYTASSPGPALTAPPPGSELSGDTVQFGWVANGTNAESWRLLVGDAPGASTYLDSLALPPATTTVVATGLPKDSSTVHARLEYDVAGVTSFRDFTYIAATAEPRILSPAPGATLTPSVTFEWTADGLPVESWSLDVGSSAGAADLFSSGPLAPGVVSSDRGGTSGGREFGLRDAWLCSGRRERCLRRHLHRVCRRHRHRGPVTRKRASRLRRDVQLGRRRPVGQPVDSSRRVDSRRLELPLQRRPGRIDSECRCHRASDRFEDHPCSASLLRG